MTQSIENILSTPDKKKEIEYNIITTMSKEANKGHNLLKNTILWWGNKKWEQTKKTTILNKNQITIAGEEREKTRAEKRNKRI